MTIYRIAGTNGSGKTTVMRRVMDLYNHNSPVTLHQPGRRKGKGGDAVSYHKLLCGNTHYHDAAVLGSYDAVCGGLDKISWKGAFPWIYDLAKELHRGGLQVLSEGLTHSGDRNYISQVAKAGFPVQIVVLDTSLEDCIQSTNDRRAVEGKPPLADPHRIEGKWKNVRYSLPEWKRLGVPYVELNREDAFEYLKEELKI